MTATIDPWLAQAIANRTLEPTPEPTPEPTIPEKVTALTTEYVEQGGDPADLIEAVTIATTDPTN